ncbi:acetate and butyrate kinase [Obba rivulosa]|uniref:Probable acetate kinase n=1 Tax=Obba rivulosa TaxID=1052685 RepID=A0A8E2J5T2_9APHY|nr:acetate and butyrate kinase [Obba rivulosa]
MSPPPANLILAANAGSSSLKISLYQRNHAAVSSPDPSSPPEHSSITLLLTSSITNLSAPPASFSFSFAPAAPHRGADAKKEKVGVVHDHTGACAHFLQYMEREAGIEKRRVKYVCHRVVHGGDYFEPVVVDNERYHHIEKLSDLAPLHNGGALAVMKACLEALPHAASVAYFDTSFHRTIPPHIASYAIDQEVALDRGLKKYGFHGLSYAYILGAVCHYIQKDVSQTNLIVMHLGSGASMCAIAAGRSLDTTMGLTPLSGLPGATRSGTVDPSLVFHYTNRAGHMSHRREVEAQVHVTLAEEILNRQAGWKALTGTADFAEVVQGMRRWEEMFGKDEAAQSNEGLQDMSGWTTDEKYKMAFELFVDRIVGAVGAYFVRLGGRVDALVFSGGVGEKSADLRQAVVQKVRCLGFEMDYAKNAGVSSVQGSVVDVGASAEDGKRVLVCRTDEQFEMAKECAVADKFWK